MKAAVRATDDRGAPTLLTQAIMDHLHLADVDDIMHRDYSVDLSRSEIAAMSCLVIDAARAHDTVAVNLFMRAGDDLAICAEAAARAIGLQAPEVAIVGGMTQAGAVFLDPLRMQLRTRLPDHHWCTPELSPVIGAGLLALQRLSITVSDSTLQHLQSSFLHERG